MDGDKGRLSRARRVKNLQLTGDHHKERYGGVSLFDEHLARLCRTHMSMRGNATDLCRR